MKKWTKDNLIFIMASKGYNKSAITNKGIRVYHPYNEKNIISRIFREICFRIPFFPKTVWFNKKILKEEIAFINVYDVLITKKYLIWLKKHFPNCKINYMYNNMVGKARNLSPNLIPKGIDIWTYDDYDSRKYSINLYKNIWIHDDIYRDKQNPEYDIFFIGRDKGRGKKLISLENELEKRGLKTKFIITKNGRFSRKKSFYQDEIEYDAILDYDSKSRAILNYTMDNQEGITLRDMESVVIGVKLITTNKNIINKDIYNKNNVFILGVDNIEDINSFLSKEYVNVWDNIKYKHTFEAMIDEITNDTEQ